MNLVDNVISDMLDIDPEMNITELYTHCVNIGTHNGLTENEVRESFTVNEQLKKRNGN